MPTAPHLQQPFVRPDGKPGEGLFGSLKASFRPG
jgi:hypothetical protein